MPYFGIILIIVIVVSLLVYVSYRNDIRKAYDRIATGSKIIDTDCGPVAQKAATIIPNAKLIEFPTGGHLLLGRGDEIWPVVADFLKLNHSESP